MKRGYLAIVIVTSLAACSKLPASEPLTGGVVS
jgi:hypothetical protein